MLQEINFISTVFCFKVLTSSIFLKHPWANYVAIDLFNVVLLNFVLNLSSRPVIPSSLMVDGTTHRFDLVLLHVSNHTFSCIDLWYLKIMRRKVITRSQKKKESYFSRKCDCFIHILWVAMTKYFRLSALALYYCKLFGNFTETFYIFRGEAGSPKPSPFL